MYRNLDEMEEPEHNGNVSLSTIKMDKIYAIDGATMGKILLKWKDKMLN